MIKGCMKQTHERSLRDGADLEVSVALLTRICGASSATAAS
jgi:hypothetical protein